MQLKRSKMWWSKEHKEWYVQVASDHERAMLKADWWEGTEQVLSKGYDYSKRYGWFIIVGVPLKQYLKHHPEDAHLAESVLDEMRKRRRKK